MIRVRVRPAEFPSRVVKYEVKEVFTQDGFLVLEYEAGDREYLPGTSIQSAHVDYGEE